MKYRPFLISLLVFLFFCLGGAFIWLSPTEAATTFIVNSAADEIDSNPGDGMCITGTGECTLRAAIMEANTLPGDDTITLPTGTYTLTIAGAGEDASATGDLDITSNLTINGAGAVTTIINGNGSVLNDRVFHITGAFTVTISGVAIRNGRDFSDNGGGIFNSSGTLTLINCVVVNSIGFSGGGIYNNGIMIITDSTVSDNGTACPCSGGGIYNTNTLTVVNSTISRNGAHIGGGIENSGTLTVTNSTISGNSASTGGGISNRDAGSSIATLNLNNVTITNNITNGGGGIYNGPGDTVNIGNSLLAWNTPNCSGTLNSQGYNLIQDTTGCTIAGDTTGNLLGVDPLLGPLQDNGGSTQTHALMVGSPAIDTANPTYCPATDQRGWARVSTCDIGSYEYPLHTYLPLMLHNF